MTSLRQFDLRLVAGYEGLIGVDEAGRGPLAGPVVSAAVWLNASFYRSGWCRHKSRLVKDSKLLTQSWRKELCGDILRLRDEGEILAESAVASVDEIEELNILGATRLAMRRAIEGLVEASGRALRLPEAGANNPLFNSTGDGVGKIRIVVDGRPLRPFPYEHEAIVRGDGKSLAIALSSILAKETRDEMMRDLEREFPKYGFAAHKGYGTDRHREAIRKHGPSAAHRSKFLRKILGDRGRQKYEA